MDYSEWELERQRRALAALLLGGGTAEDEDAFRKGERQSVETDSVRDGRSRERASGGEGRFAGDVSDGKGTGAWEAVRMASRDRLDRSLGPEVPVSAWEEILGGDDSSQWGAGGLEADGADGLRRGSGSGEGDPLPAAGNPWAKTRLDGRTAQISEAGRKREFLAGELPAFLGEEEGGEAGSRTASGGGETAGGWPERAGSLYRGGSSGLGQNRQTVVQVLEETPATAGTRRGGLGDAALQAEDSARALSLAVQRDARRYDGGFTIY